MEFNRTFSLTVLCALTMLINFSFAMDMDSRRQAEVSARGTKVMPFELGATTHLFSKTIDGGVQQVIVKNPRKSTQIRLIREHLQQIADQFTKGNFSGPTQIHGTSMPGLMELKKAKPGDIRIHYRDLFNGGQIRYLTDDASLVVALHQWFDAQLSDHGADAKEGHVHHDGMHH